ncbi:LysR family transcriptional regulator [Litoreibacter janthinus]|uniref:Transcriptional regulator, LysR family n=1 Tax=Litoreibacter janthinus TaxID=670154 RepID=A0A1I6GWH0_9RHOB|nr:LysR family transcriptional regulator [Litoreibacter janthinus]SFR46530.1 transcriptional regulator, LysR family [Litoreibacter janthinus]
MSYVETIKTFLRVYDLGSMSAAARDQRISAAVASARINTLETQLGVRLFSRTTRSLHPTEQGRVFYDGALRILEAIDAAEAAVTDMTRSPRGTLFVAAPLGVGKRFLAPEVPRFKKLYPLVEIRLRLSDRKIDLTSEGLDVALFQDQPRDSNLMMRQFAEVERVVCAAPDYLAVMGRPKNGDDLIADGHHCLNLRYPGAPEFQWILNTPDGPRKYAVTGPFESDDGDVLTGWALDGYGVILKPRHEVAQHLASGALVELCQDTPPSPVTLGFLYAHRKHQDPKLRLFMDHMSDRIGTAIKKAQSDA